MSVEAAENNGSEAETDATPVGAKERLADIVLTLSDFLGWMLRRSHRRTRSVTHVGGPYGFVRGYFRSRSDRYADLRRHLNQARIGVPYDVYLSRAFGYSVAGAAFGVFVGFVTTYLLASSGALDDLRSPFALTGSTASFASAYSTPIQGVLISFSTAVLFGVSTWLAMYYHPRLRADQRARNINVMLPHAVVFMYALTRGGTSIIDAMRELALSEDVYGEVANEFETVVRDMDEFGTPLPTALSNARRTTPSDNMKSFFDDLLSTIDSGGDITKFLHDESERYFERAKDEQEEFVQNLGLLGEVYTTVFIAAPLLFLIILLVMSFIGASTLNAIGVVIYVGMPLGVVTFGILLHFLSKPYSWDREILIASDADDSERQHDVSRMSDPRYRAYRRTKVLKSARKFVRRPLSPLAHRPVLSLVVSVPAGLVTFALVSRSGTASTNAMTTDPVWTTTVLVVLPLLVAVAPLSLFHEMKKQRVRAVVSRFPEKLSAVSNANDMGMSLTDGFDYVSRRGSGGVSREFGRVSNDIRWKHDTSTALVDCANRLRVPQVSRSMNLLSKASRTTGELSRILEVAAQDTANEHRMRKQRAQEMSGYIAVVVLSFLVYLAVVLMLDRFYLVPLYEAIPTPEPGEATTTGVGIGGGDVGSLTDIPIETYRTLFYHSALILAFGNGLLAGMMGENDLFAGLKYAIAFTLITVAAFWVVT